MTHICVGCLTIIVSDNGLSPGRRQAIIWTNAGILFIGPLGTNFSEIFIDIKDNIYHIDGKAASHSSASRTRRLSSRGHDSIQGSQANFLQK